jgi:hypothetical protein
MLPDDDDEVEIVSTSFDTPAAGTLAAGSSSNPYMLNLHSPQKLKPSTRKPRAKKDIPAVHPARPSIAAYDPHPYSYPAKLGPPVPQMQAANTEAPPAAKKQRKKKADPDAPVPEKRGAIFKKKCPNNILERVDRVMSQRYDATCNFVPLADVLVQIFHDW